MNLSLSHTENGFPGYSATEERIHLISHLPGVALGIFMLVFSLFRSDTFYAMTSGIIFGGSLILLYLSSCVYHGLPIRWPRAKRVFQVVDHCSIFVLIAGSSTPFIFCILGTADSFLGKVFAIGMWGLACLGIVLLVIDLNRFKKLSILLYLLMGFSLLLKANVIQAGVGVTGFSLIIAGGIAYCVGLALYSIKIHWTHAIFHVLCIVGSVLHCICVCLYVI